MYCLTVMRSFLINRNVSFYYWLRKRIGKTRALTVAKTIEKIILIFGRETNPYSSGNPKYVVGYEIYRNERIMGFELIGVIPERRKNPARITEESIINWGRKFFGRSLDINRIFIIRLETDEKLGNFSQHAPSFITRSSISDASLRKLLAKRSITQTAKI